MNYTELKQAILDYVEAGDAAFVDNVPNFVRATEQATYNVAQVPASRRAVTLTLGAGEKYLPLPSDFLSAFSVASVGADGGYQYLVEKDVNYIREAYPSPTDTGAPAHYALFGPQIPDAPSPGPADMELFFGPTPDDDYGIELHYYAYPESIVTAGTTWLGNNFDTVLLYGSLLEANMFIKGDDDMTKMYKAKFDDALAKLKVLVDGKNRRDAYRAGQVRIDVR